MMQPSEHVAFLNPVCKPLMNGAKCANCENYPGAFKESFYVPLRPRTNEDERRKQICFRVNVCPINDLQLRQVDLYKVKTYVVIEENRMVCVVQTVIYITICILPWVP